MRNRVAAKVRAARNCVENLSKFVSDGLILVQNGRQNYSPVSGRSESLMPADEPSIEDFLRASHEEYGIDGSPFVFPAILRRVVAWTVSFNLRFFALAVWMLHRVWGFFGRYHSHPMAKAWAELVWTFTYAEAKRLAQAVAALDAHPTFQNGCRTLKFRNCLEAMFYRSAFLDPFFRQGEWEKTEFTHPLQQPQYFVPGIPAHRFYDSADFEWTDKLEESFVAVRDEVADLLNMHRDEFGMFRTDFENFVDGWNTFIFYVNGRRQDANCERAPVLAAIADNLIQYEEGELTMLSVLNPHAHIPPHVGPLNGILRCHLPLFVPKGCGLQVGGEKVEWQEGRILVFDDSFVHDVWNDSDELRIVLFFNAWHVCLSPDERAALATLRRAYNGTPVGRNWLKRQEEARPSTVTEKAAATAS